MNHYVECVLKKLKKPASFESICEKVLELINDGTTKEVVFLTDEEKDEIKSILDKGVEDFNIYRTPKDSFILMSKTSFRIGKFYGNRSGGGKVNVTTSYVNGKGELIVDNNSYVIRAEEANGAVDGDSVMIDLGGKNAKPKVCHILSRNIEYVPGEVFRSGSAYFVKPVDKKKQGITIALEGEAIEGQRVAVSLDKQAGDNFYIGHIVRVFNHKDDPNEDILWEAFKMGVDNEFSAEAMAQLEKIPDSVRDIDRIGREDHTNEETFTIDGATTKDMDDSVGLYINDKGNYVLRVDIVDNASIIPYGSPLDREGYRKGNSYYPGGIVIPNYPRKISNGIGSLNPGVDRLCLSSIMEITPEGKVINYRKVPTVIRSKLKMNKDVVNEILLRGKVDPEYVKYEDTLKLMSKLAKILHNNRVKKGACEFERPEVTGVYGPNGKMIGVMLRPDSDAESLIEEFMIIANVNGTINREKHGFSSIYRVHDAPSVDKLKEFLRLLYALCIPYDTSAEEIANDRFEFQKLIKHVKDNGGRLERMLMTELIKTMSRAHYSAENTGHWALAEDYYGQETSDVRRYGDKMNQHLDWAIIKGESFNVWKKRLPDIAAHITHTERVADELEEVVFAMQCAEYMSQFIGKEFDATVTCVSSSGLTVQLDNYIEGYVPVKNLNGEYVHSPETYSLVSLDNNDDYSIGDRLHLKLVFASKEAKKIQFKVLNKLCSTEIKDSRKIHQLVKTKAREAKEKRRNVAS